MQDLEVLANRIRSLASRSENGPFFFGPVPDSRLFEAEQELGVTFSGSFRAYLLHLGAAWMFGYDFSGLPDEVQPEDAEYYYLSIIDNTEEYSSFMTELPKSFVFVTNDGGEVTFWIDTAIIENGESPIIAHNYGNYIKISESFLGFVDLLTHPKDLYALFKSN